MNEAGASLHEIERQRAALASRVRLPLWYRVLWALALLGLVSVPLLAPVMSWPAVFLAVQLPAIAVLSLSGYVLYRSSGTCLARNVARHYPSARRPLAFMVVAIVVGALVSTFLMVVGAVAAGIAVGVVTVAAAVYFFDRHLAGIRDDIRRGRVPSVVS